MSAKVLESILWRNTENELAKNWQSRLWEAGKLIYEIEVQWQLSEAGEIPPLKAPQSADMIIILLYLTYLGLILQEWGIEDTEQEDSDQRYDFCII